MDDLAQLLGIALDQQGLGIEFGDDGHGGGGIAAPAAVAVAMAVVQVELHHVVDQGIEVHGFEFGGRQPGVITELVDQPLHRVDLVDDGLDGFGEQQLFGLAHLAGELHFQALGRQLDGRERVLDFMRQPARHLAPGLRALGRDHFGNIVEHQQELLGAGHPGAARDQRDGVVGGAGHGRVEFERLLPVLQRVRCPVAEVIGELGQHVFGEHAQARHLAERLAVVGRERRAQDARGARGCWTGCCRARPAR